MEEKATVHNYYGMTFQNCSMPNATFQTINQAAPVEAARDDTSDNNDAALPPELDTPEAARLMEKLAQNGLLDERWQPAGLTYAERGVLAWHTARLLKVDNSWKTFGTLWRMKPETLRTAYNKGMEQHKTLQFLDRLKEVTG